VLDGGASVVRRASRPRVGARLRQFVRRQLDLHVAEAAPADRRAGGSPDDSELTQPDPIVACEDTVEECARPLGRGG